MKKYVKPLMESEAFVANEYVSSCSIIECHGKCGASEVINGLSPTEIIEEYGMSKMSTSNYYMYQGTVGGIHSNPNCEYYDKTSRPIWIDGISDYFDERGWSGGDTVEDIVYVFYRLFGGRDLVDTNYYHPVTVSEKGTSNGPNAS